MNTTNFKLALEKAKEEAEDLERLNPADEPYYIKKAQLSRTVKGIYQLMVQCGETRYCPDCDCNDPEEDTTPPPGSGGGPVLP